MPHHTADCPYPCKQNVLGVCSETKVLSSTQLPFFCKIFDKYGKCIGTVKRGDFDGRGDFDNLIKLIISIPNSCSHSSDCRLFILPCLSDRDTTSNVMNVHYLVSRTHNCIGMLGLLISWFNGTRPI